ncbi:MAG: hypothetical protein AAB250_01170, partial [Bdellovibrionota bacterium]
MGKRNAAAHYGEAALQVQEAVLRELFLSKKNVFARGLVCDDDGLCKIDETIDASTLAALVKFSLVPERDPRLGAFAARVEEELGDKKSSGRLLRFAGDDYFRTANDS